MTPLAAKKEFNIEPLYMIELQARIKNNKSKDIKIILT